MPQRRDQEELERVVEDFGTMMADSGLPRMSGRVLGWLLVCDPPAQTTSSLMEALHASKGAISQATTLLQRVGMIEQRHVRGSREHAYEMQPGVWSRLLESKIGAIARMRELAERGLEAVGPEERQRARLEEVRDVYAFVEREYAEMMRRWKEERERR